MTSTPPTTLVVSLIVVLVVLFALGIYWLLFRKGHSAQLRPTRPRAAAWPPQPQASEDEWEASAPYPEYAMQQARFVNQTRQSASAFHDTREPAPADTHPAQDLHDAWESLQEALEPEPPPSPSSPSPSLAPVAQVRCPRCLSSRVDTRNLARKAGSTIGSVAGATGGMAAALAGAEAGAAVGSIGGPLGTVFGGLAGAVIAGLAGSAAGCAAGSVVGATIDDNVLDNHLCLACGHAFSVTQH
ncbi:hypothetical protein Q2T91_16615 [Ralstonia pseudosolanacearum]|uniref:hypothetical protein n=1 Tax=Ralstonia pseudosolanacearum TaxID=1310165 RepID=UPI001FF714C3|nr:hypothetical protein [Ralstonia pseudosolanacearum]